MVDYVTTQKGVITEAIYPEVVSMVSSFDINNWGIEVLLAMGSSYAGKFL